MLIYKDKISCIYNDNINNIIDKLTYNIIITIPDKELKKNEDEYINLFSNFQTIPSIIITNPKDVCNLICEGYGRVTNILNWNNKSIAFFNYKSNFKNECFKDINLNKLLEKIILSSSCINEIILDPFNNKNIREICKNTNRKYIGIIHKK